MYDIVTTIETLPNELLITLFEYISGYDLYNAFLNLNSRFNSIITVVKNLHFTLEEDWDSQQRTIPFFASHISKLIIKHDEPVDFSFYPNIRSLKLCMPTGNQCNAIGPGLLPNLEHLCLSNLYFSDNSEQLCRLIFSTSLSRLQTCQIDRLTLNDDHRFSSFSLRQLTISPSAWKSNMYKQIFDACPNLTNLQIMRLQNISFELPSNLTCSHTSLRHLYIHFHSIGNEGCNHIDWLLSKLANLQSFTLIIDANETKMEFPFDLFANLLTKHVPYLTDFNAKIPINNTLFKPLHRLFNHIKVRKSQNQDSKMYLFISSEA